MTHHPSTKENALGESERKLLMFCVRAQESFESSSQRKKRIQETAKDCKNWESLLDIAHSNSVTPLLYLSLRQCCPDAIPPEMMVRLKESFYSTARKNLKLTAELLRVLKLCEQQGIRVLAYKGPLIAAGVYGEISFREFDDLDILVEFDDLARITDLLLENGYRATVNFDPKLAELYFKSKCESCFVHSDKNAIIEIHWTPVPKYFADIGDSQHYLSRAQPYFLGRTDLFTLSPEDLVIVLSVHGARHLWHSLKWICDLDRLIRQTPNIDWNKIIKITKRDHLERMLYSGLHLTTSLLLTPIPSHILTQYVNDSKVNNLASTFEAQLFQLSCRYGESMWTNRLRAQLLTRTRDRIRYLMGMVFRLSEDDVTWIKLPSWCYSIYYILRPLNLMRQFINRMFKRLPVTPLL